MAPHTLSPETFREDLWNGEAVGVALTLALVVINRLLLPPSERHTMRRPVALLALHVAFFLFIRLEPGETRLHRGILVVAVALLLAALGRAFVVLVLDVVIGRRFTRPLPKIVRDVSEGGMYLLVGLAGAHAAGIELGSLLATSAVLTAVIGLSLQDTLGNLIAGLAIQVGHPFDVGDWIQFDPDLAHVGRVVEISWRATKVLTAEDVEIVIPNGVLGRGPISNFSKPRPHMRRDVRVTVPRRAPVARVERLLVEACEGAFGVLAEPLPYARVCAFTPTSVEYALHFWTDRFDVHDRVDGGVRKRLLATLAREQIDAPAADAAETRAKELSRLAALRAIDFLAVLPDEPLARVAAASREVSYVDGERVLRKGETSTELFIVHTGAVRVLATGGAGATSGAGEEVLLARLGAGEFFGEMSLMTGEPRQATVVADGDTELFVLSHAALKPVLDARPELAERISEVLAERQAHLEEHAAASARDGRGGDQAARATQILGRLRSFFSL